MERPTRPAYSIVPLPHLSEDSSNDHQSIVLANKLRELRLYALKTAPKAFAASWEVEKRRGLDHSLARLRNLKAAHFVAIDKANVRTDGAEPVEWTPKALEAEWVGMILLMGPQEGDTVSSVISARSDPFASMTAANQPTEQEEKAIQTPGKLHYHLNAIFVHPAARKSGLGERLIHAALQRAADQAKEFGRDMSCSLLVDSDNEAARRLYETVGFVEVGEERYVQQPRALVEGESHGVEERVALRLELRSHVIGS